MNTASAIQAPELKTALIFANELAECAAEATLPYFRAGYHLANKTANAFDPVTNADKDAETRMRAIIAERFPDDGISGEEFPNTEGTSGRTWILDPIDGTRSFIMGVPLWATLIGLMVGHNPALGLMDQPFTKERYIGWAGNATLKHGGMTSPLKTSTRTRLDEAFLAATAPDLFTGAGEQAAFSSLSEKVRLTRFGGDSYFYCQLAAGNIDLVVEAGLQSHDIIPLIPIVEGAGGVVSNWQGGSPLTGGQVIAAANKNIHARALDVLNA